MSETKKEPSAKLKALLEKPIALAKKEFGEKWDTRYSCSVVDVYGYRCSESSKPPLAGVNEYCPKHGNPIQEYSTQQYADQPWQDALNDYFYATQNPPKPKKEGK